MNCHVQVSIGEEQLNTAKAFDTKEKPPYWTNDVLTFKIPISPAVKKFIIVLKDEDNIIGQI